ncbi:MAG TPA: hypothetical protein VFG98_13690 [Intrasporangium sp.]|nr:hypothetical protein [Intrasporangium sp.]
MTTPGTPEQRLGPPAVDDEVARLKQEIARLKAELPAEGTKDRRGWWRPLVAGLLVALAALLAPLSVLATWANGQIQETDRYLETVAPLADDPAVQDAIATRMEEVIFTYLDLESATQQLVAAINAQGLQPQVAATLEALAGPLAGGIRSFVSDRIHALVESEAFEELWTDANRVAHSELVAVLTGEGGDTVSVDRGSVEVNLAPLISTVKQQLTEAGFGIADRIPEVQATYTIVESADLAKAQKLLSIIDGLSTWLPVIALLLVAAAVIIARDRRRTLLAAGLAVAGAMLLLGATLNIIRPFYLDALPTDASTEAAAAVYDQLVSFIRFALRGVLVVALTVAIVAWLNSRTGAGAATRRAIVRGIDALRGGTSRSGLRTGRLGLVLAEYRTSIRVGVVGVAALAYLLQDHPTGGTALTFVIVTAVVLLLLEVLAAAPAPAPAVAEDADIRT